MKNRCLETFDALRVQHHQIVASITYAKRTKSEKIDRAPPNASASDLRTMIYK